MKRYPIITPLLLAALLLSAVSCGSVEPTEETKADTTAASVKETPTEAVTEADPHHAATPGVTFGGMEYRIAARSEKGSTYYWQKDLYAEKENAESLNDAVFRRNVWLEDTLDIKIVPVFYDMENPTKQLSQSVLAGDDSFDVIMMPTSFMQSLAENSCLYDLNTFPGLDLSAAWWDQNSIRDLSIANKLYYVYGDFTIADEEATWIMYFNKQMQANLDLENFYDLVNEGKWTSAKFAEFIRAAASDINGDGAMKFEGDRFGYSGEIYNILIHMVGCDALSVEKNGDDLPNLTTDTDRFFTAVDTVLSYLGDPDTSILMGRDNVEADQRLAKFYNGEALFLVCGMQKITVFRDLVSDFGLLPMPKLDEEQKNYYTSISFINAPGLCIPKTVSDPNSIGLITECYAEESKNTILPAYYDIMLKRKGVRDEESSAMLDIVIGNKRYDLGYLASSKLPNVLQTFLSSKKTDFASTFASIEESVQKQLDEFTETLTIES